MEETNNFLFNLIFIVSLRSIEKDLFYKILVLHLTVIKILEMITAKNFILTNVAGT